MNATRCLRIVARPTISASLRPSVSRIARPQQSRTLSLLTPRRPILPTTTFAPTSSNIIPTTSATSSIPELAADLIAKSSISAHPALGSLQIRCGPRDTYNPSHFVRKRRHGFLTRLKSKKGRKTLMRRILKGRKFLSH